MVSLSPSSTLVNVAEDAELRLIRLLADASPAYLLGANFVRDCEACIVNADARKLIETVIRDAGAIGSLFVLEPVDEAVSAFSLLTALLAKVTQQQQGEGGGLAQALADAVSNVRLEGREPAQLVERQVSLLSVLYNMCPVGNEKCGVLARMIGLAGSSPSSARLLEAGHPLGNLLHEDVDSSFSSASSSAAVTSVLPQLSSSASFTPSTPRLISMLDSWDVTISERRQLYRAVAQGMPKDSPRKQRFLLLLVASYKDQAQLDKNGLAVATEAAVGAIRDPVSLFVHQRNMMALPAVMALASSNPSTSVLFGLLKVFQEGKLDRYHAYVRENGGESKVLAPWGLSPETCVEHMRILSLCSLASEFEEIPYSVVAETLLLDDAGADGIERWVIAAVSSGLLSAKMDQLQGKVMVERCVVRRFDIEQWKVLQSRLQRWKANVGGVLRGIQQTNAAAAGG